MSFSVHFTGQIKRDKWDCYAWTVDINGERFDYYTGLAHATRSTTYLGTKPVSLKGVKVLRHQDNQGIIYVHVPKLKSVLSALASDAQAGQDTFDDFCSNFGYETDSRKALDTYLKCQDTTVRLRKIIKSKNAIERILEWGV